MEMKRYLLIGTRKNNIDKQWRGETIGFYYAASDEIAFDKIGKHIWENHKNDIERYKIIFLLSDDMHIIARASNSFSIEYIKTHLEYNKDLKDYRPVYVDVAEHDERVLLSEILDLDYTL